MISIKLTGKNTIQLPWSGRFVLAMSFVLLFYTAFTQSTGPSQPNFILIYCDNLGYGDIEPFGSKVNRTPHLNRMAREGRIFTHFYSTSGVCTPSRASIMTGCYSQRVGMSWNDRDGLVLRPISPYGLNPEEVTIAEVLKNAGYATGIIGKWHLGDQDPFLPTRQGFDYFYGIPYSDDMTREVGQKLGDRLDGNRWPALPLMRNETVIREGVDRNLLTKDYTEKALEFITQHRSEPFFLYLPHAMPGSTKEPFANEDFRGKSQSGPWGDSVEELDWSTGQILDKLVELDLDHNTLVVFTSDNGSPMGPDLKGVERGTNRPLSGRGYTTAEGGFRIPAVMWWPGKIPEGTVCGELASTMDFLPTFAALGGGEVPEDRIVDGKNIWPLMEGRTGAVTPYEAFYYYDKDQLQAVRSGPWKLFLPLDTFRIHPYFERGKSDQALLFNVEEDISSQHNLALQNPDVVRRLTILSQKAQEDLGDFGRKGKQQRPAGKVENPVSVTKR